MAGVVELEPSGGEVN